MLQIRTHQTLPPSQLLGLAHPKPPQRRPRRVGAPAEPRRGHSGVPEIVGTQRAKSMAEGWTSETAKKSVARVLRQLAGIITRVICRVDQPLRLLRGNYIVALLRRRIIWRISRRISHLGRRGWPRLTSLLAGRISRTMRTSNSLPLSATTNSHHF